MPIIVVNKVNKDLAGRSGTGFSNNSLDTINTTLTLELNTTLNMSIDVQVVKLGNVFTLTSGSWSELIAAFNGATIDFRLSKKTGTGGGNPTQSTTVVTVSGADMELAIGGGYSDGVYSIGFFQITSAPEQFDFSVNLVDNNIQSGIDSLIDGESQRFSATLVNALTISGMTDSLIQLGNKSGGSQFTTTTIERIADATNGNKVYEVIVIYKNWLCISSAPFFSSSAVGDYYEFQMFMINADPSVLVSGTHFQTGNTGFEDESFNGFPSAYNFVSIAWEDDLANPMDTFDFSQNSNFTIELAGAAFKVTDEFNFKMFTIPNDGTEFQNRANPIENNLMLAINNALVPNATPTNITGNLNDNGAGFDIQNFNVAVTAGISATVTGKVVPNAAFNTLFASKDINDRKYKIWIQCEDSTATFKSANTVNVLSDDSQSEENILPLGKWLDVSTLTMQDHNDDVYIGRPDPYLEDDILANVEFTLPKDVVENPWLSIRGRVVAQRISDGERFTIEEFVYDISGLPTNTVTGILPLDFTQNRGFKLPATSNKHDVTIQLFPSLDDGSNFGVQVLYPFIVRYEDWLKLPQANDDFFSTKNQNWFQYSDNANWNIRFEFALEREEGEFINEIEFDIHDYDDWGEVPGTEISFKKLDDTAITKPFADEVTKVTVTHEVDTETWNGNEWVTIHVRPENGAPQWLIGTVLNRSDANNPLITLSGETKGKITVGTKIVTIEAAFDPFKDIDLSGNVTFTSRISGSTTGGQRGNIFKETFTPARSKLLPQLVAQNLTEEDRGYVGCCDPFIVLADEVDLERNKNDIAGPRTFGDSVVFNLTKNGIATTYVPMAIQFPNQPDAWYAQIEWRDVLLSDGVGCYSIDMVPTIAGVPHPSINWGSFDLKRYDQDGYLNAKYTARLLTQFNDVNNFDKINYTDSFLEDSLRIFNGKFGYFNPNTEVDFVEQLDGTNQKVKTEDFFEYELRVNGITKCVVTQLLAHVRGMTNCWMSSYNYDDFDYIDLSMKNVILSEGFVPDHKDGSRLIDGVVKFREKVYTKSSGFADSRQTGEAAQPSQVCPPSSTSESAKIPKTGQTFSFRDGDDGFFEAGRDTDFFTLPSGKLNWFGTNEKFTDTVGTQVYANDIILDHSTEGETEVLGYDRRINVGNPSVNVSHNQAVDACLIHTNSGFTNWRLPNRNEFNNLLNDGVTIWTNYVPLNLTSTLFGFVISTVRLDGVSAFYFPQLGTLVRINVGIVGGNIRYIACKDFTKAELGL